MINLLGLSNQEIQQKRKAFLLDFYKEINRYTDELLFQFERRNLNKNQLKDLQKELENVEKMRELFFSEIKMVNKRKVQKPVRRTGLFGFNLITK